jgi:dTMP kinase
MRNAADANDGIFVVIEGIDGAGTTTQCERYGAHLRAARRLVHITREPSAGPVGSLLRLVLTRRVVLPLTRHAQTMSLLFAADRMDHLANEIEPYLRDGYVVLCDRYDLSSLAYQSITADPADAASSVEWIRTLNGHARRPDVTLVLDVSPEIATQRRRARGGAAEIFDDAELQARLASAYRQAEAFVPADRVIHIDSNRDPDAVALSVAAALDPIVSARPSA